MDIVETVLGKAIDDLTIDDVVQYFQAPREESDTIEYKSGSDDPKQVKNILKGICAMLNSSGGIIFWGAPREERSNGVTQYSGDLIPVSIQSKDQIANRIAEKIQPLAHGVRIEPLKSKAGAVYIIKVDESPYKPHACDSIFYMRLDGQTRIAPHHYVEAMFKRITFPNISASASHLGNEFRHTFYNEVFHLNFSLCLNNLSRFNNAIDVEYSIYINGKESREHSHQGKIPILFYGKPFEQRLRISIPETSKKLHIDVVFGSRHAPLKRTWFEATIAFKTTKPFRNDDPQRSKLEQQVIAIELSNMIGEQDVFI